MMAVRRRSTRIFGALISTVACLATVALSARAYGQHPGNGSGGTHGGVAHPPHPSGPHPAYRPPPTVNRAPNRAPAPSVQSVPHTQPPAQTAVQPGVARPPQSGVMGPGGGVSTTMTGGGTEHRSSVPQPPARAWDRLPQGAGEKDRPPSGQCRVWLKGVPESSQPAPTSCGTARKNMTPGSSLIFGDDHPSGTRVPPASAPVASPPE